MKKTTLLNLLVLSSFLLFSACSTKEGIPKEIITQPIQPEESSVYNIMGIVEPKKSIVHFVIKNRPNRRLSLRYTNKIQDVPNVEDTPKVKIFPKLQVTPETQLLSETEISPDVEFISYQQNRINEEFPSNEFTDEDNTDEDNIDEDNIDEDYIDNLEDDIENNSEEDKKSFPSSKLTNLVSMEENLKSCRSSNFTNINPNAIEENAKSFLGTPYVWGATGPNKFDCSGFTQWVFRDAGVKIPRVSRDQAKVGEYVDYEDLQRGDMVFFDTKKHPNGKVTHVGIYLGNGDFIHASSAGKKVVIFNFNKKNFYKKRFLWGRRLSSTNLHYASK